MSAPSGLLLSLVDADSALDRARRPTPWYRSLLRLWDVHLHVSATFRALLLFLVARLAWHRHDWHGFGGMFHPLHCSKRNLVGAVRVAHKQSQRMRNWCSSTWSRFVPKQQKTATLSGR